MSANLEEFEPARDFQRMYPSSIHTVVNSHRDFDLDEGWAPVREWIARAPLYQRYVVILRVALEIEYDGTAKALASPRLELIEVEAVRNLEFDPGDPKYELHFYRFADGAWEHLLRHHGDFSSLDFDLKPDAPVEGFASYWQYVTLSG